MISLDDRTILQTTSQMRASMKINRSTGILNNIEFITSPNCDARPDNVEMSLLVIHSISLPPNQFDGPYISQLFCNQLNPSDHPFFEEIKDLKVSAHLLIRRDGEMIQYVPFHKRAWHAGISEYNGQTNCNDFSIGIEMEGTDHEPYEAIQYQQLAKVTQQLMCVYPTLTQKNITGHCDIAPGRKTDPGIFFDWGKYRRLLEL